MRVESRNPRVRDLVFRNGSVLDPEQLRRELIARPPHEALAQVSGHFALHSAEGAVHVLARDPLGVAKLFYALGADGQVHSSNFLIDLLRAGHRARAIGSVPSGHFVRLNLQNQTLEMARYVPLELAEGADPLPAAEADAELARHGARIRAALSATFQQLAPVLRDRPIYVTLSGGLDSTTIAALTRLQVGTFTALTFAMDFGGGPEQREADDLYHARRVAEDLGVKHEIVSVTQDELLSLLDDVLLYGQDFRDFNVHCALVNVALARFLERRHAQAGRAGRPVVLTGDGMNELVADYTPVKLGDREHYVLPRLSPGRTRRFLLLGLDAGDREVGVFARAGVDCIQPYLLCPEVYTALPDRVVESENAKQKLARSVMGSLIPEHVYKRPKVRAQVGSSAEPLGTLAALTRAGVDGLDLERRFETLFGIDPRERRGLIRAGMYRFHTEYPGNAPEPVAIPSAE
jgi:asparagine synthetase B (glutamine-hydrolysing)